MVAGAGPVGATEGAEGMESALGSDARCSKGSVLKGHNLKGEPLGRIRALRTRRLGLVLLALVGVGAAVLWWLSGRPLTYSNHVLNDEHPEREPDLRSFGASEEGALDSVRMDDGLSGLGEAGGGPWAQWRPTAPTWLARSWGATDGSEGAVGVIEATPLPRRRAVATQRHSTHLADVESYLLAGVDNTRGRWGRTDSIVVALFDDESGHAGLVSVPRDLWVDVPGHGPARINATLRIAARQARRDDSVDPLMSLKRVVEEVLALSIDHVIVGDLSVFERTVDGLGGIEVHVPCPMIDDFVDRRSPSGRRVLSVEAGLQSMDGVTAAMYARSRHGRSDWDRARRQHAILSGLRRRLGQVGLATAASATVAALESGVITTMSRLEMLALVRRGRRLDERKLHGLLLGSRQVHHHRTEMGQSVLVPDFEAIDAAMAGLFEAPAPGVAPRARRCRPVDAALRPRREGAGATHAENVGGEPVSPDASAEVNGVEEAVGEVDGSSLPEDTLDEDGERLPR